jgi:hypothetical protein
MRGVIRAPAFRTALIRVWSRAGKRPQRTFGDTAQPTRSVATSHGSRPTSPPGGRMAMSREA